MMRHTSLKDLPSAKALRRVLLVASGVVAWLGGEPGANGLHHGRTQFSARPLWRRCLSGEHLPGDAGRACPRHLRSSIRSAMAREERPMGVSGPAGRSALIPPVPTRASSTISPSFSLALVSPRWSSHPP